MAPTTVVTESRATRLGRRLVTIPAYLLALGVLIVCAPVAVPLVAMRDLVRGSGWAGIRLYVFGIVFLLAEMGGLLASFVGALVTAGDPARALAWYGALQTMWTRTLLATATRLFGFRFEVVGEAVLQREGPMVVLARHVSIADTLLPSVFVTHRHGIRLRYVLKRELLWDPCLDVVGQRLPNVFVDRSSTDSIGEIAAVRALAAGLGSRDGILIYPEGTRFTSGKHARVLERIAARDPARYARVRALRRVLPVQLGGASALLGACPGTDILFLAHTGFDAATTLREVFDGALVGRTIRVAFWRVPASQVPGTPEEWPPWLDQQWARMDDWVAGNAA